MARQLKYYVASTADGFIADVDGSFDCFPTEGEHLKDLFEEFPETVPHHLRDMLGVSGPNRHFDAVLMGRKTYEVGTALGFTNPYRTLEQYVISSSLRESPDPNVQLVREDPVGLVRELKRGDGKDIWLCGGGALAAALFEEIDGIILKLNPVVIGAGTPLFARGVEPTHLELTERRVYDNGFLLLHYRLDH